MVLSEVRSRVYTLLGEDEDEPLYFSKSRVNRAINRAYFEFAKDTRCLEFRETINTIAGQSTYDLPDQTDRIFRVAFDKKKIFDTSVHELDRFERTWQESNHESLFYTTDLLDKKKIRLYGVPQESSGTFFDSELGVIVDTDIERDLFRFESDIVSLGVVVDYENTDESVVFVIGTGGGSDSGYGIVTDISTTLSYEISFSSDLGAVVDIDDEATEEYDQEDFTNGVESTKDTEYGEVTDIDDPAGIDSYIFMDQNFSPFTQFSFTQDTGEIVAVVDSEFNADEGITVAFGEDAQFNSELGIVVNAIEMEVGIVIDWEIPGALEVWGVAIPMDLDNDEDELETPDHTHIAIAYLAAARLLMNKTEVQNLDLANTYGTIGNEYKNFTRNLVVERQPEDHRSMRPFRTNRNSRQAARLPSSFPRVRR